MNERSKFTISPGGRYLIWQRDSDGYWWHIKTVSLPPNCLVAREGFNPNPGNKKSPSDRYKFPTDE